MDYEQFISDCLVRMEALASGPAEQYDEAEFNQLNEWVNEARSEVEAVVARQEAIESARAAVDAARGVTTVETATAERRGADFNVNVRTDPFDLDALPRAAAAPEIHSREARVFSDDLAARAETVLEGHLRSDVADWQREAAQRLVRKRKTRQYDADAVNEHIIVSSSPQYIEAFEQYLRSQGKIVDPILTRTAMSLTAANGGVLVPQFLDPTIILTNSGTNNVVRQLSRNTQITVDQWDGVTSAGVTAEWLAEGSQVADATPTFVGPTISVHKGAMYAFASYEVLMDSGFDEIGMLFADAKDRLEESAFTTGTGSGQPFGLITRLSGSGPSVAGSSGAAGAADFVVADIYAVKNALGPRFRRNAAWQANPAICDVIRQFDTAGGGNFWTDLRTDTPPSLIGKGIYENEAMDGTRVSGSNDDILLFGDHQQYNVVDRIGMDLVFDPLVLGANARPTGQAGWFGFFRTGADVLTSNAFKLLRV